jgi:hypothetical protein
MREPNIKFRVAIDRGKSISFGIGYSWVWAEKYMYIDFLAWELAIGWLDKDENE